MSLWTSGYLDDILIQTTHNKLSMDCELVTDKAYAFRKGLDVSGNKSNFSSSRRRSVTQSIYLQK